MKRLTLLMISILILSCSLTFAQNTIDNPFFQKVDYVGGFGSTDWTSAWTNFNPQTTAYPNTNITIPAGDITTNTSWTSGISPLLNAASFSNSYLTDPFFDVVTMPALSDP